MTADMLAIATPLTPDVAKSRHSTRPNPECCARNSGRTSLDPSLPATTMSHCRSQASLVVRSRLLEPDAELDLRTLHPDARTAAYWVCPSRKRHRRDRDEQNK